MEKHYKKVLTIAGSDSGGGAGIQADIKTISACGCYAMSAITAITVQNTIGVSGVYPVPLEAISGQISAVLDDIGADAIKIGMLHSSETIKIVTKTLDTYAVKNIVLDPVMVATSGDKLLQDEAIETLKSQLIPVARVITPNIPEAEILLGKKIQTRKEMSQMARELSLNKKVSVLLKAGHLTADELVDIFYNAEEDQIFALKSKRIFTKNTHGTGCTLSSAIASFLALGLPLNDAVKKAKEYIDRAIVSGAGYALGKGHGPVHHFFKYWK
ncbi:MAG: bifunctional hydroxymethylpyrimidine kinase/phosphomethylpyrimidine kinase [Bacteroidales bacterium]|nr:bifunctional hydroxymethylpyrimidine kinase/phosphomethylpyrimidine kinase [Bacteroidales bacterium]